MFLVSCRLCWGFHLQPRAHRRPTEHAGVCSLRAGFAAARLGALAVEDGRQLIIGSVLILDASKTGGSVVKLASELEMKTLKWMFGNGLGAWDV